MSEVKTNKITSLASNNDITLDPDGTGDVIVASGNVGIGTASPSNLLTLQSSGSTKLNIRHTASGDDYGYIFRTTGATTNDLIVESEVNGTATERMRIDSSGQVMIGTTTAAGQFTVTEGDATTVIDRVGTNVAGIKTGSGDDFCVGTDAFPQAIRIKNNTGKVGIGTTDISSSLEIVPPDVNSIIETHSFNTSAQNHMQFRNNSGTEVGTIYVTTSSTAYNTSSDHRLKENVADMTGAITRVKALTPKRFNFIIDPDTTVDGFLAHEAQTVVPESVTGTHNEVDDDGNAVMQGIDQSKLVPLLVGALKESIAKIETLETKVAALEAGE